MHRFLSTFAPQQHLSIRILRRSTTLIALSSIATVAGGFQALCEAEQVGGQELMTTTIAMKCPELNIKLEDAPICVTASCDLFTGELSAVVEEG